MALEKNDIYTAKQGKEIWDPLVQFLKREETGVTLAEMHHSDP